MSAAQVRRSETRLLIWVGLQEMVRWCAVFAGCARGLRSQGPIQLLQLGCLLCKNEECCKTKYVCNSRHADKTCLFQDCLLLLLLLLHRCTAPAI
jgi:hypothetical protein